MDSHQIGRCKFVKVLDALSIERQNLLALQERTLDGDFPESYYEYTLYGGDFSEVQEAILDDLRDKITSNCTRINETRDWIERLSPRPSILIKPKISQRVTFHPEAKTYDADRERRKKPIRPVKTTRQWHASLARELSLSLANSEYVPTCHAPLLSL